MVAIQIPIELPWWPLDPDESIGMERAREVVNLLGVVVSPVVDAVEADLQHRLEPGAEIVRSGARLHFLARVRFGPEMRSLCVGAL